jgi:glycosyltransferase involved in cell wall biosynthesis
MSNVLTYPISVIIPCYRSADTIERALGSVLNQTYLPAQIILIDDASNDGSSAVLHQLKNDYPAFNIVLDLMSDNMGPGMARNRGWELASHPWLAFLDADDAWHPLKLEICWKWIQKHPETILLGHQTKQIEAGVDLRKINQSEIVCGQNISFLQMLIANRFYTRTVMLRREVPYRFQNRQYTEDYLLWLEIVLSRKPSYVLNQSLALSYRPEYSSGGYSGQLWTHEKRELRAWRYLYKQGKISILTLGIAQTWSYIKYIRRVLRGILA